VSTDLLTNLLPVIIFVGFAVYVLIKGKRGQSYMDWTREKTQECVDISKESLKVQKDMAQTLKDIKTILEKR